MCRVLRQHSTTSNSTAAEGDPDSGGCPSCLLALVSEGELALGLTSPRKLKHVHGRSAIPRNPGRASSGPSKWYLTWAAATGPQGFASSPLHQTPALKRQPNHTDLVEFV